MTEVLLLLLAVCAALIAGLIYLARLHAAGKLFAVPRYRTADRAQIERETRALEARVPSAP